MRKRPISITLSPEALRILDEERRKTLEPRSTAIERIIRAIVGKKEAP